MDGGMQIDVQHLPLAFQTALVASGLGGAERLDGEGGAGLCIVEDIGDVAHIGETDHHAAIGIGRGCVHADRGAQQCFHILLLAHQYVVGISHGAAGQHGFADGRDAVVAGEDEGHVAVCPAEVEAVGDGVVAVCGADGGKVVIVQIVDGAGVKLLVVKYFHALDVSGLDVPNQELGQFAVVVGPSGVVGRYPHAVGLGLPEQAVGHGWRHVSVGSARIIAVVVLREEEVEVTYLFIMGSSGLGGHFCPAYERDVVLLGGLDGLVVRDISIGSAIESGARLMVCNGDGIESFLIGFEHAEHGRHIAVALVGVQVQVGLEGAVAEDVGDGNLSLGVVAQIAFQHTVLHRVVSLLALGTANGHG